MEFIVWKIQVRSTSKQRDKFIFEGHVAQGRESCTRQRCKLSQSVCLSSIFALLCPQQDKPSPLKNVAKLWTQKKKRFLKYFLKFDLFDTWENLWMRKWQNDAQVWRRSQRRRWGNLWRFLETKPQSSLFGASQVSRVRPIKHKISNNDFNLGKIILALLKFFYYKELKLVWTFGTNMNLYLKIEFVDK